MPMIWNADADAKLFAAVLATSDTKINYAAVAERMGSDCTAKAIIHRIAKIKDTAKSLENGGGSQAMTPPKTPGKRGRPKASAVNGSEEDSPTAKKAKTTPRVKANAKMQAPTGLKREPKEKAFVKKEEELESSDDTKSN